MAEYIEREQAIQYIRYQLMSAPSANVKPVVYGEWIVRRGNYNEEFECSVCHHISKDGGNYCSYCGADMRKGET